MSLGDPATGEMLPGDPATGGAVTLQAVTDAVTASAETGDADPIRDMLTNAGVPLWMIAIIISLYAVPRTRAAINGIVMALVGVMESFGVLVGARHTSEASKKAAEGEK
jgi:hypothetical protein